jgi:hypothetical protein
MIIPAEWLAEAGVEGFRPAKRGFHCKAPHQMIALDDIEVPLRRSDRPLGANGFCHDRMVRLLSGIRDDVPLPVIWIENADPGQRRYRMRCGVHRYHASLTLGFTHIPAEIVPRIDY